MTAEFRVNGFCLGVLLMIVSLESAVPGAVGSAAAAAPSCAGLEGEDIAGVSITSAALIAATGDAPEYCAVNGLIAPELRFELRLPTKWNGKFHYNGTGGWSGQIRPPNPAVLAQGYADLTSNGGHDGKGDTFQARYSDGSFAHDPSKLLMWARLSVATVTPAAKEIIRRHYGEAPRQSYFEGCSGGGRDALMTALYYPGLFDGVLAGAPGGHRSTQALMLRAVQAAAKPGAEINSAKMAMITRAVLAECDTVEADGLVDGVVSNWAACHFDPKKLRCPGGADAGDACLSDPQLAVIEAFISPIELPGGTTEPGYFLSGVETTPGQLDRFLFGAPSVYGRFATGFVRDFLAKDQAADPLTYDINEHAREFNAFHELQGITPHLGRFLERGKLILWTGAGDPSTPPAAVMKYYEAVVDEVGGRAKADASMRFYVLGGVAHCGGGVGADRVDALLPALDAWVTKDKAPKNLVATKLDPRTGDALLSRPLCSYPEYPRYKGAGDPNDAASFTCVKAPAR